MKNNIVVREIDGNDASVFWDWYCDPLHCILFPKERSLTNEQSRIWFRNMLKNQNDLMYIALIDIVRIGAVWFKKKSDGCYEAFIYLKPAYTRQGLAPHCLKIALGHLGKTRQPKKVSLNVRSINPASRAIFEREGFLFKEGTGPYLYWEQQQQ